ncbi:cas scaffolding protein family member 4 [Tachyglossus aculeatus]|uniref:cas scaffolding protein family member 4 n=1 Tax=Tachyglossus aculeatus TaxID=9261 RepID=UPI0018F42F2E|nr:cas scaffolding protein family member 4 [Tachyglossus aculeatus]
MAVVSALSVLRDAFPAASLDLCVPGSVSGGLARSLSCLVFFTCPLKSHSEMQQQESSYSNSPKRNAWRRLLRAAVLLQKQNILAKALYDNQAECADELAFCRGDILNVLEKNVPESEGWWKCSLHGRKGLAPANRLQLLSDTQAGRLSPPPGALEGSSSSPQNSYQVPSELKPSPPAGVYEKMVGWVKKPSPQLSPATYQVYELPEPLTSAKIFSERTVGLAKQALFTLPRPTRASLPTIHTKIYDVPSQQCTGPLFPKELEQHQVYDIPAGPDKARISVQPDALKSSAYDVPPAIARGPIQRDATSVICSPIRSLRKCVKYYNTLPTPRKPGWIYDVPASPEKTDLKQASPLNSPEKQTPFYDVPPARYPSGLHNSPKSKEKLFNPQTCTVPSVQKKISLQEFPIYDIPSSRDAILLQPSGDYNVPPSFLIPRVEQQNTKQNIYDIPKGMPPASTQRKEPGTSDGPSENFAYAVPSWLAKDTKSAASKPSECDRLSISSLDSRASTLSTCSSSSTDSSPVSPSEDQVKEAAALDLELAKETMTGLQHRVASSIASLMIFVSSKWRFSEYLKATIDEIHRAADHIQESLGEFLDFARDISMNADNLTDSNLQTRIKKQLQIISDSYQILLETKEALNNCNWSLDVLITDKLQNNPDDLDRFVMVARTIPEDIKRFAAIIVANGKLLFKPKQKKEEPSNLNISTEYKIVKCIQLPRRREIDSHQNNISLTTPRESQPSSDISSGNRGNICENVESQKSFSLVQEQKPILNQETARNKDSKRKVFLTKHKAPSKQDSKKKVNLSEHCRLYFSGLLKAISVFNSSLSSNQPPETFIAQSKLIIMVGQKLVDALCQETQEKDVRNEILCNSSQLCSLLKNLAVATKNAAVQHPNFEAMGELQAAAENLTKHILQFRETLE